MFQIRNWFQDLTVFRTPILFEVAFLKTQLGDFFTDDEVIFYKNINELSDQLNYYKNNNYLRKKIAKNGQDKYFNYFDSKIVSRYMIDKIFDIKIKKKLKWMSD